MWRTLKKLAAVFVCLLVIAAAIYLLRFPILRAASGYLMYNTPLEKADVVFVFSGSPFDRGRKAAQLLKDNWAPRAVCTGEIYPGDIKALGSKLRESDLTRSMIASQGVDTTRVSVAPVGTSSFEEAQFIYRYCKEHKIKSAILVSNSLHMRRIYWTMEHLRTAQDSVVLQYAGAPASEYSEMEWWKNERGLIFVNNEYVKLVYYWLKY